MASVGKGTVRLVLVTDVARACASAMPLRVKLMTGKPKPEFVKPFPAMVKLGAVARSIRLGVMELTPIPLPLTVAEVPAFPVKFTFPGKVPKEVGPKRTVTVWLWPALRL